MARGKVTGTGRARRALSNVQRDVTAASERATQAEAEAIADEWRDDVPVDEGDLKDSIGVEGQGAEATVAATAEHALFVVFGTTNMPAQDFATPAAEKSRTRFPNRIRDEVRKDLPR